MKKIKNKIPKIFFDRRNFLGLGNFENFCDFHTFWIFRKKIKISETPKFSSVEKIFSEKLFLFFISVKCMNVAFQQAIGHLLTPSGRGERAIWTRRPRKLPFTPPVFQFCCKREYVVSAAPHSVAARGAPCFSLAAVKRWFFTISSRSIAERDLRSHRRLALSARKLLALP